ncbi:MAG: AAA family ATPase [Lachnospiraceae bacterium]|nr:AAA family ATPase [Lachnospiraceae bacterium]
MKDAEFPVFSDSPVHLTALTLKPADSPYPDDSAETTWDNFFRLSRSLPPAAWLGWQLAVNGSGDPILYALSGPACPVTDGDLAWLFRDTMSPAGPACPVTEQDLTWLFRESQSPHTASEEAETALRERGRLYALRFQPDALESFARSMPGRSFCDVMEKRASDFLETLKETGAVFRFLCTGVEADEWGRIAWLLAFPEELSLRTRAVLSGIFPFGQITEISGDTLPEDCFAPVSSDPPEYVLDRILVRLMKDKRRKDAKPEDMDIDDAEDDDDLSRPNMAPDPSETDKTDEKVPGGRPPACDADSAPLRVLELSPRSFNCLRRAGVLTVGDLRNLSDSDLMGIRNLGTRQQEEIRTKLARFLASRPADPQETVDYRSRLRELIGLEPVKAQVSRIEAYARMKQDMAARGIATLPMALNMAFLGNPGTAKTTVARILAGILHEIGILSSPEPVETGRADLVGKYVGHTACKVKEIFHEARGRLLFIDEAYSLVDGSRSGFGDEAINTIVQEMENRRDGTVVVFAGYPREMEEFIARNPGLSSRIPFTVRFEDYSPADLARIVRLEAERRGFSLDAAAAGKVRDICGQAAGRPGFGNGRFCRNLAENAILSFADRVYGSGREQTAEPSAPAEAAPEFILSAEDFEEPRAEHEKKPRYPIGFCA